MCNAWNHPPGCTCGWGGEGSTGGGNQTGFVSHYSRPAPSIREWPYRDFTHPTRCPECGGDVFFIRHNGGSVWVDDLGWPWPKHPCFDRHTPPASRNSLWSPKTSGLKNPKLAVIVWVSSNGGVAETVVQLKFSDSSVILVELRWSPPEKDLVGALVAVSLEDEILLHPTHAEITFTRPAVTSSATRSQWYTCPLCKASVRHGTGHEAACRKNQAARQSAREKQQLKKPAPRPTLSGKEIMRNSLAARVVSHPKVLPAKPEPKKHQKLPVPVPVTRAPTARIVRLPSDEQVRRIIESIAIEAWQEVDRSMPPDAQFGEAKHNAVRLIKMLSPSIRRTVEHHFTSSKWSPLLASRPKAP